MTLIDQIWKLSRGKATKSRIGSRAVPHRLTQVERLAVERALSRGYLEVHDFSRANPENIYRKLCEAEGRPAIVVRHSATSSRISHPNGEQICETRKEAKEYAKTLFTLRVLDPSRRNSTHDRRDRKTRGCT